MESLAVAFASVATLHPDLRGLLFKPGTPESNSRDPSRHGGQAVSSLGMTSTTKICVNLRNLWTIYFVSAA
jgi:hypothetical protein